jgi:hypothetical protein
MSFSLSLSKLISLYLRVEASKAQWFEVKPRFAERHADLISWFRVKLSE